MAPVEQSGVCLIIQEVEWKALHLYRAISQFPILTVLV